MTRYRIGVRRDSEFVPTGHDGQPLPETEEVYAKAPVLRDGRDEVPYAEYLHTWGNPARHIGVAVVLERLGPEAVEWEPVHGVWGIDVMDDDPEATEVPWHDHTVWYRLDALPVGYLGDVARELLAEHGVEVTR